MAIINPTVQCTVYAHDNISMVGLSTALPLLMVLPQAFVGSEMLVLDHIVEKDTHSEHVEVWCHPSLPTSNVTGSICTNTSRYGAPNLPEREVFHNVFSKVANLDITNPTRHDQIYQIQRKVTIKARQQCLIEHTVKSASN